MITLEEWFARGDQERDATGYRIVSKITCADGFQVSVQASKGHYCTPQVTHNGPYTHYELGYPSEHDPLLDDYQEDPECDPTETVYPYVPVMTVLILLASHGGIAP